MNGSDFETCFDSNFNFRNNGNDSHPESVFDPWEPLRALGSADNNSHFSSLVETDVCIQMSNSNAHNNGKNIFQPSSQMPKKSKKPKAPMPPSDNQQTNSPIYSILSKKSTHNNYNSNVDGVNLLDVRLGKSDAIYLCKNLDTDPYGIALYEFLGIEDGDLSFKENEKIYLLKKVSEEWYFGRKRSGCEGIFPINYIEIKVPLTSNSTNDKNTLQQAYQWPKARSLYNFSADVEGDLALKENELITIYYKINDDWLYGEVNGRLGQFPSNFIDRVPANLPAMPFWRRDRLG